MNGSRYEILSVIDTPELTAAPTAEISGWRRLVTPSIGDVLFLTVFSVAMLLGGGLINRDGDLGRHILFGRSIINDGVIPSVDVYSHTMFGAELIPHSWMSQAVFATAERWLGFDGIGLVTAALIALPWMVLYRWLVRRDAPIWVSLGVTFLAAVASMIHWAARPHLFTWLFVVVWVCLLEDFRRGRRDQVWWLVPLALIWANTHAGFIVGLTILAIYLLGEVVEIWRGATPGHLVKARHLAVSLVATAAASVVTPGGIGTIVNAFSYLGEDFLLDFTTEYTSPDFHNLFSWPFLAMLLLTIVLIRRWEPTPLLLTVWGTAAALYSFRNIPIYAIVMTPVLVGAVTDAMVIEGRAPRFPRMWDYAEVERHLLGGALAVLFVVAATIGLVISPGASFGFSGSIFPIDAVESLRGVPPGERPFHMFSWGGYLEYCCHPEILVFIDGQTDFYGSELTMEYDRVVSGRPDWAEILEKHDVDWVMIDPEVGLAQVLAEADDWVQTYRDDTAVIFVPAA